MTEACSHCSQKLFDCRTRVKCFFNKAGSGFIKCSYGILQSQVKLCEKFTFVSFTVIICRTVQHGEQIVPSPLRLSDSLFKFSSFLYFTFYSKLHSSQKQSYFGHCKKPFLNVSINATCRNKKICKLIRNSSTLVVIPIATLF